MKTLKFLIPAIALLGLFANTSCEQIEEVLPPSQNKTVSYQGNSHEPLGNATLTTNGTGAEQTLQVSNLGSSGEDGVEVVLSGKNEIDLYFKPVKIPDGGYIEYGAYASGQNTPGSGLRVSGDSGAQKMEVFFEGQDKVTVEGYRDGQLIFREEEFTGSRWLWLIPVAIYVLDHTSAHYTQNSNGTSEWGVDWNGTNGAGGGTGTYPKATVTVGKETYREIDLVKVISAPVAPGTAPVSSLRVKAANIPDFTFVGENVR